MKFNWFGKFEDVLLNTLLNKLSALLFIGKTVLNSSPFLSVRIMAFSPILLILFAFDDVPCVPFSWF